MNSFSTSSLQASLDRGRQLQEKRTEKFDGMSEKWQESEKGEAFEMRTQDLESCLDDLENAIDALNGWSNEE